MKIVNLFSEWADGSAIRSFHHLILTLSDLGAFNRGCCLVV